MNIPQSTLAPYDILTYTQNSNFDPAFSSHRLNASTPIIITLDLSIDPSLIFNKQYNLYAVNPLPYRLVMLNGTFVGVSVVGRNTANFNGVSPGEGLTFIVLSPNQVQVIALNGVTFVQGGYG